MTQLYHYKRNTRKRIVLLLCLLLPVIGWAQQAWVLKGALGNVMDSPAMVYLYHRNAAGEHVFDSAAIHQGLFELKGTVDKPTQASLFLTYRHLKKLDPFKEVLLKVSSGEDFRNASLDVLPLYLEPGVITLQSQDSLFRAVVSGTPFNEVYSQLNQQKAPVLQGMKNIILHIYDVMNAGKMTQQLMEESDAAYKKEMDKLRQIDFAFIHSHPATPVSLNILMRQAEAGADGNQVQTALEALSSKLQHTPEGQKIMERSRQMRALAIGAQAPGFTQKDTAGVPVSLAAFKGKYVFIDFWASWCGPCRAQIPDVLATYNAFKNRNFTVIGVSLDTDKNKWLKAIADDKTNVWAQVCDLKGHDNTVARLYNIEEIPQNCLVGPDGKIIARNIHGSALQRTLTELLKETAQQAGLKQTMK